MEGNVDFTIISINWTGQNLTPEQLLVLRNAAAEHLRKRERNSTFRFKHDLCEGLITREKEGIFVTFAGTFFTADLGITQGERWTVEFLLPHGTEEIPFDDDSIVISSRPLSSEEVEFSVVDHTLTEDIEKPTVH